ncbi:MAG: radical SAM protein [Promethearchaeota archaeon]
MSNFCPHLWNGFTIRNNGDIYSCCLSQAFKLGNIYEVELKQLINIPTLLKYRKKSLEGDLKCYNSCTFVKKDILIEKIPNYTKIKYSQLKKIDLIFGRACNISCIMCIRSRRITTNDPILNPKILQNNIDITPFKEIIIQGGEPLFIPECLEYMKYLEEKGKKYTILTNGVLINDEMAQRLSLHAKRVIISINATNFAYIRKKIAIYCDGAEFHLEPERWENDRKIDRELILKGWKPLRFTGREINRNPQNCVQKILDLLNL